MQITAVLRLDCRKAAVFAGVFGRNVSRETFLSPTCEMALSDDRALARCANIELICVAVAALN
jgi:hypothetical protein